MSEEKTLQEINDLYVFLTEKEPTPDDEIEAREKLIKKFEELENINTNSDLESLIKEILTKLNGWDTLDLWFMETDLPKVIKKIIAVASSSKGAITEEPKKTEVDSQSSASTPPIDIKDIVSQVAIQFKDEIGGLKDQIAMLQEELKKKDSALKKKEESIEESVSAPRDPPKKKSLLPPPEIRLPQIKTPTHHPSPAPTPSSFSPKSQEQPKIEIDLKPKAEVPKLSPKIEQVIAEKPKIEPVVAEKPKIQPVTVEKPKIEPVVTEKFQLQPATIEKLKIEPVVSEKPKIQPVSVEKPKIEPVVAKKPKIQPVAVEMPKIQPATVEKPKIEPVSVEKPKIEPVVSEKPKIQPATVEKPKIEPVATEKPRIQPVATESPGVVSFTAQKPKISPVAVEEVKFEPKSSGADLFNVFSSVGQPSDKADKTKKKRGDKRKKKGEGPEPSAPATTSGITAFGPGRAQDAIEEEEDDYSGPGALPKDKDGLYQELIALEGRRYSLEKSHKELDKNYEKGTMDDFDYKAQSDQLKYKLNEITERINSIRRLISTL